MHFSSLAWSGGDDSDTDGFTNAQEIQMGTSPTRSNLDTDRDGIPDADEQAQGTDPASRDSDGDTLIDSLEIQYGTDPLRPDGDIRIYYTARVMPMPAGFTDAEAMGINDAGWICGYASDYQSISGDTSSAFKWDGVNQVSTLGFTLGDSYAYSVNQAGDIAGESDVGAFVWKPTGVTKLMWRNYTVDAPTQLAWAVNEYGVAVGRTNWLEPFRSSSNGSYVTVLKQPSAILGYAYPSVSDINDQGQAVGHCSSGAIIWQRDAVHASLLSPGLHSAVGISNSGRIIGQSGNIASHRSVDGVLATLSEDPQTISSVAVALNDAGEVIGSSEDAAGTFPVLWRPNAQGKWTCSPFYESIIDEEVALSFGATSINNKGQIAGSYYDSGGISYAVILDPVFPPRLLVDADRDGQVGVFKADLTNEAEPFRFWSNEDDDDGDDKRSAADDIPLSEINTNRDSANDLVDGIRDLEDFFPVFLDMKRFLNVLPIETPGIAYYLKHEDGALGVVFTNYKRTEAFNYLRGAPADLNTGFGPALTQKAGEAKVVKITAAGVDISTAGQATASPAFFDRIKNHDGGVLLVEASKATTKPLILEVRKGTEVIAEVKLHLKTDPVETMFRYYNLRSYSHGTAIAANNQGPGYGTNAATDAPNDPFQSEVNRKNLVFVHGYNVNGEAARGSAATVFKRFYWSGSKAKFYAVLWRGDDGQDAGLAPDGATPDYHRNVGHAWQQGVHFRDFLLGLSGDTAIMAHSLGNVVAKVALTHSRGINNVAHLIAAPRPSTVKHYFAVDAAVPLEATSADEITTTSQGRLRHSIWARYDAEERIWPTHWYKLFEGSGDARAGLTWRNVFANLEVGTNFYSSGEEVLANPVNDEMPLWEPLFFGGRRAWVAQEKIKGGNGAAAVFFRSARNGGWGINGAWIIKTPSPGSGGGYEERLRFASEVQDVPGEVPTSALSGEPFFLRFQDSESGGFYPGYQGSRLHAPIGDANAGDETRKLVTIAKCLGEAIPALSYAQGSNPANAFTGPGMGGNADLNTSEFKNGWPISRGSDTDWKHSDCLDVSYIFHFKLYDRMKTNGGLQ